MKFKSHSVADLNTLKGGEFVKLAGWVKDVRDLGKIKFLVLRDSTGEIQITWKMEVGKLELGEKIDSLRQNDVISISGELRRSSISRTGLEIIPEEISILNRARHPLPLDVTGAIEAGLDVRLDFRPLDLMRPQSYKVFRLYSEVLRSIRNFFLNEGFAEVVTPKLISKAVEGGANLFPLNYFANRAFLAQSPQLYKEQLTMGLEKVFEIATYFRAEPFDTTKHLNEFVSVDIEVAFADCRDVMELLEKMIMKIVEDISRNSTLSEILVQEWKQLKTPFPIYTYDQVFEKLRSKGIPINFGDDFTSEQLKEVTELRGAYFVIEWPRVAKPFYIKSKAGTELTESFDFMWHTLEICSGGTREENPQVLRDSIIKYGLNVKEFEDHLDFFGFGMPPHAGWGLGFQRLLMALCGAQNIREVTLYPRDRYRLAP